MALKGAKSQLQQERTYGGVASSRIRPLTRLVGKFSKSKVSPKKKFARLGGHLCCGEFNAFKFPCQDIIDLMCESRSDNNNAGEASRVLFANNS